MFHLYPCKLYSWFSQWLVWVLPVDFLNGKWGRVRENSFPGKGTTQKRSKHCLRRGSLGKQAVGFARAVWAHCSYSLPQVWGGLFPWVLSCQSAAREERGREDERESFTCFWHLDERMVMLCAGQEDALHQRLFQRHSCWLKTKKRIASIWNTKKDFNENFDNPTCWTIDRREYITYILVSFRFQSQYLNWDFTLEIKAQKTSLPSILESKVFTLLQISL